MFTLRAESPSIFLENIGKIEGDSARRVYYIMNLFVNFKLINFWENLRNNWNFNICVDPTVPKKIPLSIKWSKMLSTG